MIHAERYIDELSKRLKMQYGSRVAYIGLQGSYLRGEATDNSDIDIMVVIDDLSAADLDHYRAIIESMESPEKSCGFICSKTDLQNWNPLEIHHLLNSTKDCCGTLAELVPVYAKEDIRNFVRLGLNNLYHEITHRHIHGEQSIESLSVSYKTAFFILQNLHSLTDGRFISNKAEMLALLSGNDHAVLQRAMEMSRGCIYDYSESFQLLFSWCQETLKSL